MDKNLSHIDNCQQHAFVVNLYISVPPCDDKIYDLVFTTEARKGESIKFENMSMTIIFHPKYTKQILQKIDYK